MATSPSVSPPKRAKTTSAPAEKSTVFAQGWSGPLPPPGALAQFNDIIPNGAERIMSMVELEQKHRFAMDKSALRAEIADTLGGKLLGGVMILSCVVASVYSALHGAHWAVSVAIVGVPLTALIGKLIKSK